MSDKNINKQGYGYELIEQRDVYKGFFIIREYWLRHQLFSGKWSEPLSRELFVRGNSVAVLLYDPEENTVAILEQFRIGAIRESSGLWLKEIVAGMVEDDEIPVQVALRECYEETGVKLTPDKLVPICNYLVSPGGTDEKIYLFCGVCSLNGVSGIYGCEDENEDIRVSVMPLEQAVDELNAGKIISSPAIICLQWLQLNHHRFQ
jgi:ADP-ribose pyrophosphatase